TYQEPWKSRPLVEARLGEAAWSEDTVRMLKTLAVRWANNGNTRQGLAVRKALGETLTEEEHLELTRMDPRGPGEGSELVRRNDVLRVWKRDIGAPGPERPTRVPARVRPESPAVTPGEVHTATDVTEEVQGMLG